MNKRFFILLSSFIALTYYVDSSTDHPSDKNAHQESLAELNQDIEDLEDQKDKFDARAARYQDKGDRLQFQPGNLPEARRAWKVAENSQEISKRIEEEIIKLKGERDELLKKMGDKGGE